MGSVARLALLGALVLGLGLMGTAGLGCDRNIAPFDPDEAPSEPDLSRIFPAPERTGPPAGAEAAAAGPPAAGRAGAAVRGTVHLDGGDPGDAAALFVIARPAGAAAGPPLAVLRIAEPSFPLDFEIGPANVMIPTMRFEGPIELSARLDTDGNASTRAETDRATASPVAVAPGDAGVVLRLE